MKQLNRIRIKHEVNRCVGNKNCLLYAPHYFSFSKQKAHLQDNYKKANAEYKDITLSHTELNKLVKAAYSCSVNVISIYYLKKNKVIVDNAIHAESALEIVAEKQDNHEMTFDKNGYFLIKVNKELQQIEVGLCRKRNIVAVKIVGKTPEDIYKTIIKHKLLSRFDHAAYLGKELQKAYIAFKAGKEYIQDDDLEL
jgi:dihydropteroate synthase